MFILGIITGVLLSILFVGVMTFFRTQIERRTQIIEKEIYTHAPMPKGFVFEPEDESTATRNEIIERNKKLGRDTKLSDLQ